MQMFDEMKTSKAHGSSDVSLKLIATGGEVGIHVMAEFYQRVLNGVENAS